MGGPVPKQYRLLDGLPVLRHTLIAFLRHSAISSVRAVIHPADLVLYHAAAEGLSVVPPVMGGETRLDSVRLGLESIDADPPQFVVIHDGVRPFVEQETISAVIDALDRVPAVIAALPVPDTLKRCEDGIIGGTVDRTNVWRAQTPQGFRFKAILEAHRHARRQHPALPEFTDDSLVAEYAGLPVAVVHGSDENFKITTERDLLRAEQLFQRGRHEAHTGWGFDFDALGAGDHVMLCGIKVAHAQGIVRQHTGDIALNAVTDALLGSIGGAGQPNHFNPQMPLWHGTPSEMLLRNAATLVAMKGGRIVHVDLSIICETLDVAALHGAMMERLAGLLSVSRERISLKRPTALDSGFFGRRQGIAAQCLASIHYPVGPA